MINMVMDTFFFLLFLVLISVVLVLFSLIICFIGFVIEIVTRKEGIFCRIIDVFGEIFY